MIRKNAVLVWLKQRKLDIIQGVGNNVLSNDVFYATISMCSKKCNVIIFKVVLNDTF